MATRSGRGRKTTRRQYVNRLIDRVGAGIARPVRYGQSLPPTMQRDTAALRRALDDMQAHIVRVLSANVGHEHGPKLTASLFPATHEQAREALEAWDTALEAWEVDQIVLRAVRCHFLVQRARELMKSAQRKSARRKRRARGWATGASRARRQDVRRPARDRGRTGDLRPVPAAGGDRRRPAEERGGRARRAA
jgi:hypothetical protein